MAAAAAAAAGTEVRRATEGRAERVARAGRLAPAGSSSAGKLSMRANIETVRASHVHEAQGRRCLDEWVNFKMFICGC
jgi:hypothetical protein